MSPARLLKDSASGHIRNVMSKTINAIGVLIMASVLVLPAAGVALAGTIADTTGRTTYYGVFVGIEDSGHEAAKKVRDKLVAIPNGGWKAENTKLVDEGQATVENIGNAIDDLKKKAKPGDEFLFYFVGHAANGWIDAGPDGELDTEIKGDDVKDRNTKKAIMPGPDGILQSTAAGDDKLIGPKDGVKDTFEAEADPKDESDAVDNWIGVDNKEHISDDQLTKMLSGFPASSSMAIVLEGCFTASFTDGSSDLKSITQKKEGKDVRAHDVQFIGSKHLHPDEMITSGVLGGLEFLSDKGKTKADNDGDGNGVTTTKEIFKLAQQGTFESLARANHDSDHDGRIDEDFVDHHEFTEGEQLLHTHLLIDNDDDGQTDEDPDPVAYVYDEWGEEPVVGGEMLPSDMTSLFLAGASANASWIIATVIAAAGIAAMVARRILK